MSYCNETSAVKCDAKSALVVSLKCKSWNCPDCMPKRKAQLIAEAIGGKPDMFLTLTSRKRDGVPPHTAALELSRAWSLIRKRLMRKPQYKKLPFIAVLEKHKSGWPHMHILLRAKFIPHALLSEWMEEICDGPVVWIERLRDPKKAGVYCSKYCGKAEDKIGTAKRYWQSRDYDLREEKDPQKTNPDSRPWIVALRHIDSVVDDLSFNAYEVKWLGPWRASISFVPTGPP